MINTKQKYLIIGIGELLWDVFPSKKKIGGAIANFVYHSAQLGSESILISAVGNDTEGEDILRELNTYNMKFNIQRSVYPTGIVQISLDKEGVPDYKIPQPAAWDYILFDPAWQDLAKNASAVCFGSLGQRGEVSQKTIYELLRYAPKQAYKVFDINLRQSFYSVELINKSLALCNILKLNDAELMVLTDIFDLPGSFDQKCRRLISKYDLKMLVLTCGDSGSHLFTGSDYSFKETPKVSVADTVGAGDSFTAAVVSGLLNKRPLSEIHEIAVRLSAFVCSSSGGMPMYSQPISNSFV